MEHMKNEFNTKIRQMTDKELEETLIDLRKQKDKLEYEMRTKEGTSVLVRNYPKDKKLQPFGNVHNINKNIARIKTEITARINKGDNVGS